MPAIARGAPRDFYLNGEVRMPIYEYACKNCEHRLDALQKMADDPLVDCPECGEPQLKRMLSAPRFRLKGKGWYETDFKKDNQRNLSTGDDKSTKPSDKSDKTSEPTKSKTESKTESKPSASASTSASTSKSTSSSSDS
jgi:putative FmdB family regulatory protein